MLEQAPSAPPLRFARNYYVYIWAQRGGGLSPFHPPPLYATTEISPIDLNGFDFLNPKTCFFQSGQNFKKDGLKLIKCQFSFLRLMEVRSYLSLGRYSGQYTLYVATRQNYRIIQNADYWHIYGVEIFYLFGTLI